jgi:small GTP-binding protein
MALFNYATKEITLKIVYYGPGLSGKTTNLQYLHSTFNPDTKGKLLSLSTESDRTLFFDFLPVELGKLGDFIIRFQLYTVPGQVRYNATRKIVLRGADTVIFVADSQREMREQNIESFENMLENLRSNNINPDEIPIMIQYNKRDLKDILSIDELNHDLNSNNYHFIEASAINGTGVEESYKLITKLLLKNISKKHKVNIQPIHEKEGMEQSEVINQSQIFPSAPVFETTKPKSSEEETVTKIELETSIEDSVKEKYGYDLLKESSFKEKNIPLPESSITESTVDELVPEYKVVTDIEESVKEKYSNDLLKESSFKEDEELSTVEEIKEIKEVPVIPIDKINMIIAELENITKVLIASKNSFSALIKSTNILHKDMKEIQEIKKEQRETNTLLRDILNTFDRLKIRKSWFRF